MSKKKKFLTNEELEASLREIDRQWGLDEDDEDLGGEASADEVTAAPTNSEPKMETTADVIQELESEIRRLETELREGPLSSEVFEALDTARTKLRDAKRRAAHEEAKREWYWKNVVAPTFITREEFDRKWNSYYRQKALEASMSKDEELRGAMQHPIYRW